MKERKTILEKEISEPELERKIKELSFLFGDPISNFENTDGELRITIYTWDYSPGNELKRIVLQNCPVDDGRRHLVKITVSAI